MNKKPYLYWYRGNVKRGNEIIAILEDEGGVNRRDLSGMDTRAGYYINAAGQIDVAHLSSLIRGFYTERQLPKRYERWRAEVSEYYFYIDLERLAVCRAMEIGHCTDNDRYEHNNYYQTQEKAEKKLMRIINVLSE